MKKTLLLFFIMLCLVGVDFGQVKWSQYQGPFAGNVVSFATYGDTLFAGTGTIGVFKSADFGKTWTRSIDINGSCGAMFTIDTLIYGSRDACPTVSHDGGRNWRYYPMLDGIILGYSFFEDTLYAVSSAGVYAYSNDSDSWLLSSNGLGNDGDPWSKVPTEMCVLGDSLFCGTHTGLYCRSKNTPWLEISKSASGLNVDYGVQHICSLDSLLFATSFANQMIFQSSDTGKHWTNIGDFFDKSTLFNKILGYNDTLWLATNQGVFNYDLKNHQWQKVAEEAFTYLYTKDSLLFGSNDFGLYRWDKKKRNFCLSNFGINNSKVYDIALFNDKLIAATNSGSFFIPDTSKTWYSFNNTRNQICYTLGAADSLLLLGTSNGLYSLIPDSTDFKPIARDYFTCTVWDIDFLDTLIYAATDDGLFVSKDTSKTWKNLDPAFGQALKVATCDTLVFVGNANGLYELENNHLQLIGFNGAGVRTLKIIDGVVFVSDYYNGLNYKSTDTCKTWKPMDMIEYSPFYDLLKRGNNLYATSTLHIFYSSDMGDTWDTWTEQGMPDLYIYRIIEGKDAFYTATFGQSIWTREYLSEAAVNTSSCGVVSDGTISKIPANTNADSLEKKLSLTYGASGNIVHNRRGDNSIINSGDMLRVTAENGIDFKDYLLQLASTEAILTSSIFEVDQDQNIVTVPDNTSLSDFKANVTVSSGASFEVYNEDGITIASELVSGCIVKVLAEDGVSTHAYTISVATTVVNNEYAKIQIYPIPVVDRLYINGVDLNAVCSVFDMAGQVVAKSRSYDNWGIDVAFLPKGSYVLCLEQNGKKTFFKFVK
ncbi:MAG TPA: T9SS type A sorting domain-containing protein [Williamwhitmania sp.]|nr:T9SS type A sorting domain-containing protein [Williamwhitmania sp.]